MNKVIGGKRVVFFGALVLLGISAAAPMTARAGGEFVWPVDAWVTSTDVYSNGVSHSGSADLAAPFWTPITAARGGTVILADPEQEGNVKIDHGNGWVTGYGHIVPENIPVREGQTVQTGEIIAYVGQNGIAPYPHCHFTIWKDGVRQAVPGLQFYQWVRRGEFIAGNYGALNATTMNPYTFNVRSIVSALELRRGPGLNHSVAGTVARGTVLTVLDSREGFYKVRYNNADWWVVMSGVEPTNSNPFGAKVTASSLEVRTGPGASYPSVGSLSLGTLITVFEVKAGWYKIQYGLPIEYRWVSASGAEITDDFRTFIAAPSTTTWLERLRARITDRFRASTAALAPVRSGPGAGYSTVGAVDLRKYRNRRQIIYENQNGWYKIAFNGDFGWIEGWKTMGRIGLHNFDELNARPLIFVDAADLHASEPGTNIGAFNVRVIHPQSDDLSSPLTIRFIIGGTAGNGTDYDPIVTAITLPAGVTTATITVRPKDDTTMEGPETVTVGVAPSEVYTGSPVKVTVTVADNDTYPCCPH